MGKILFPLKATKGKNKSVYKTLYLSQELSRQIEEIAVKENTSFNNVVVSMIEYCLREES